MLIVDANVCPVCGKPCNEAMEYYVSVAGVSLRGMSYNHGGRWTDGDYCSTELEHEPKKAA